MDKKAWIYSIITYIVLTVALILLFDHIWPNGKVLTKIVPFVVSGLITHIIRKIFDFILEIYNFKKEQPFLEVSIRVDNSFRRFAGYGASCGEIIQAGNFKANYEVGVELNITLQNESANTAYEVDVSYTPNNFSKNYSLKDIRENKLQPLEGNKHFEFKLRIVNQYYDVYASDVDKEIQKIYKIGKDISLLNGSKVNIKYKDSKHKTHIKTIILE